MIPALIRELVLPLLVFLLLRVVLRGLFAGFRRPDNRQPARPQPPPVPTGGVLQKDPVCGTYVPVESSISYRINGRVVHFCSQECSAKYRAG